MIDKYSEIQRRILLYNACKGVLRAKTAAMNKQAVWPWLAAMGAKALPWIAAKAPWLLTAGKAAAPYAAAIGSGVKALGSGLGAVGAGAMKAAPYISTLGGAAWMGTMGLQSIAGLGSNAKNIQQGFKDGMKYLSGEDSEAQPGAEGAAEAAAGAEGAPAIAGAAGAAAPAAAAAAKGAVDPFDDEFEGLYADYQNMDPAQQKTLLKNLVKQQLAARNAAAGAAKKDTKPTVAAAKAIA